MGDAAPGYTFRDSDIAAERLRLLARVFEPEAVALLQDAAPPAPPLALDLGCGPGHTTRLVAQVTRARRTVGIDSSVRFLRQARTENPGLEFLEADVTAPLPVGGAGLIFGRLLLTHLDDPGGAIAGWASALAPGGRLLVDEVEWIDARTPLLREYLAITEALIASRGGRLYIGGTLARHPDPPGLRRTLDRVQEIRVTTADAAGMFSRNIAAWRDDPFIRQTYPARTIQRIAGAMDALLASRAGDEIRWGYRQIAWTRSGDGNAPHFSPTTPAPAPR